MISGLLELEACTLLSHIGEKHSDTFITHYTVHIRYRLYNMHVLLQVK